MRFRQNILEKYLSLVPIPLALERVVESKIYTKYLFEPPILDIGCGDGMESLQKCCSKTKLIRELTPILKN
jgi:hypothetical protein